MSQLTEQYFRETGERALYRMASSDYHTLRYVNWLEAMVEKFTSTNAGGHRLNEHLGASIAASISNQRDIPAEFKSRRPSAPHSDSRECAARHTR